MSDEAKQSHRPSASAEAAAQRWRRSHPDEDVEHDAPSHVPEPEDEVPNRHSASAEAASLRWHERHPDDPGERRSDRSDDPGEQRSDRSDDPGE